MELMKPTNDFVFKRIFGSEENKDLLLHFLNATLRLPEHQQLMEIELINPNLDKRHPDDKLSILDISARTVEGVQINIEVQLHNEFNLEMRTLYYWAKLFTDQLTEGVGYDRLKKTITINIVNFIYLREISKHHSVFHLREAETGDRLTDLLEIHFIELPKFEKHKARSSDPLSKWLLFLEGVSMENMEGLGMTDPAIEKAYSVLEILSQDKEARMIYEARQKAERDRISGLSYAKLNGLEEGRREGTKNNICMLLEAKFGADSHSLQQLVQKITDVETLDQILVKVGLARTLEEAEDALQEVLNHDKNKR